MYGSTIVEQFRAAFPKKTVLADAKILSPDPKYIELYATSGVQWVSVMASSGHGPVHSLCTLAHAKGLKVQLNLAGAASGEQTAMEAKKLGVDALLVTIPFDQNNIQQFLDTWELIKGNSTVPLFLATNFSEENIAMLKNLSLEGVVMKAPESQKSVEDVRSLCTVLREN
jgi:3-keto-L-gulonate-6-phosphate decarboxylase